MQQKQKVVETLLKEILEDMTLLKDCRKKLDEIALRKLNHSNVKLFSQMIEEEKKSQNAGFQARIYALTRAKDRAEAVEKMVGASNPKDLFPQYKAELARFMSGSGSENSGCSVM